MKRKSEGALSFSFRLPSSSLLFPPCSFLLAFYFYITDTAVCAPLGVERSAGGATIVHLAREQVGDDRADYQNAAEDGDAQERVLQPFYFSLKLRP